MLLEKVPCHGYQSILWTMAVAAALLWDGLLCPRAIAQPPSKPPVRRPTGGSAAASPKADVGDSYDDSLKRSKPKIVEILHKEAVAAGDREALVPYYRNYALARWRRPENIAQLPKFRADFRNDLAVAKTLDVHNWITDIAIDVFPRIAASSNAPPALRINAALMVGELNLTDPVGKASAKPLAAAIDPLLQMVNADEQIDGVKAAALFGLLRHAELGVEDDDVRQQNANAMVKLVEAPTAADDGQAWIKSQAIEILGFLGGTGENNAVPDLLSKILGDADVVLPVRRAAARALGRLNYVTAGLNTAALAAAVGKFVVAACRRAKTDLDQGKPVTGPAVRSFFLAATAALSGSDAQHHGIVGAAKGTPQESFAAAVLDNVEKLRALIEKTDIVLPDAIGQIATAADELNSLLDKGGQ
jgi:hypothetical protein